MEKICGIYKITNTVNGKVYVGQSVHILKRWKDHLRDLNNHTHINCHMQSAFDKYGAHVFAFDIIERCDRERLNDREQYWIKTLDSFGSHGYNLTAGGEGNQGWHWKKEDFQHLFMPVVCLNTLQHYESIRNAEQTMNVYGSSIANCCRGKSHYAGTLNGERLVWMFLEDYNLISSDPSAIQKIIENVQNFKKGQSQIKTVVCLNNGKHFRGLREASDYACIKGVSAVNGCALGRLKSAGKHPDTGERLVWAYLEEYEKLTPDEIALKVMQANSFDPATIKSVQVVCLNDCRICRSATEAARHYGIKQPRITTNCINNTGSSGYYEPYRQWLVFVYKTVFDTLSEEEIHHRVSTENQYVEFVGNNAKNSKPVMCLNTNEVFPSSVYASQKYGITSACIRMACRGTAGCAGRHPDTGEKLKWKYVSDALPDELALIAS